MLPDGKIKCDIYLRIAEPFADFANSEAFGYNVTDDKDYSINDGGEYNMYYYTKDENGVESLVAHIERSVNITKFYFVSDDPDLKGNKFYCATIEYMQDRKKYIIQNYN